MKNDNEFTKCKNKKCNNKFKIKKDKRFCSHKCQTQYNSLRRYYLLKDNPIFKEKAKKNWGRWFSKNRQKYNKYMRDYMNKKIKTKNGKYKKKQKEYYLKLKLKGGLKWKRKNKNLIVA